MKHSKRYIVLAVLLLIVFLFKFQVMRVDADRNEQFRGGNLEKDVWYPLVAEDVNGKRLTLIIDNKEYTNDKYLFYMDHNRNIMVPVEILRDAMNCSAHIYDESELLVEKHNYLIPEAIELELDNQQVLCMSTEDFTIVEEEYEGF